MGFSTIWWLGANALKKVASGKFLADEREQLDCGQAPTGANPRGENT